MRKAYVSNKLYRQIVLLLAYPAIWWILIAVFGHIFALNEHDVVGTAIGKAVEELFLAVAVYLTFTVYAATKFGKFQYFIAASTLVYSYIIFADSYYNGWKLLALLVLASFAANLIAFLIYKISNKSWGIWAAAATYLAVIILSGTWLNHTSDSHSLNLRVQAASQPLYLPAAGTSFPYKSFQYFAYESPAYYSFNFGPTVTVDEYQAFGFSPPSDCGINPALYKTVRPCRLVGTAANGSELWRYDDTAYNRVEYLLKIDNTVIDIAPGTSHMSDSQALSFAGSFKSLSQDQLFQKDPASAVSMKNELKDYY